MSVKRGDIIEATIHDLASSGKGVARLDDGMTVFVEGALPGARVKASIQRVKKRFAEALMAEHIERSPYEVTPECPHYSDCGGCSLQHMSAEAQLEWKNRWVRNAVERIGGLSGFSMLDPVSSPNIWRYRNKMEFVFGGMRGEPLLGLRKQEDASVMSVPECRICTEETAAIYATACELVPRLGRMAYNPKTGKGYLRRLVVRHHRGGIMVHLITAMAKEHAAAAKFGRGLMAAHPEISSFVHSTRKSRRDLAFGERVQQVIGDPGVMETLSFPDRDAVYGISPNAFFQPNTATAELLYGAVRENAALSGTETVMDLYCGTGGLAVALADKARRVIGFELSEESVKDARKNAALNELANCEFRAGSLESGLGDVRELPVPDVLITDPPRSGMHENIVRAIQNIRPKTLLAVSCDPATLARDMARLADSYALESIRAVDQFPHTTHVEALAVLRCR